jgi:hypothetical protein
VLVVANETLGGSELRERILGSGSERVEVDVLAPVLTSRVHLGVTDIDRELDEARERLRRSLAWARAHRIHARGEVGSTSPVVAIEDELRAFGADEVIVVTHTRASVRRGRSATSSSACEGSWTCRSRMSSSTGAPERRRRGRSGPSRGQGAGR